MEYDSQFLQKRKLEGYLTPKAEVREIPGKGKGIVAIDYIKKGEIVSITGGVIIPASEWESFRDTYGDYAYFIEENFLIAPLDPKNPSDEWRMNHCCEPNCGMKGQIVIVALRDISVGEELLYDYAMTEVDPEYKFNVVCHHSTCRKVITGSDWKKKELQQKYKGFFSLFIQEKIDKET